MKDDLIKGSAFDFYLNRAKRLRPSFLLDEKISPVFEKMVQYFSLDPEFEKCGTYSLNKGLFLLGSAGVGKTLLASIFSKQTDDKTVSYRVISCPSVAHEYLEQGVKYLKNYFEQQPTNLYNRVFLDDLGAEETQPVYMGSKINCLEAIITRRYENRINYRHTHFSSNLKPDAIEKVYGTRIRSRLAEMVNVIVVGGPDRRK